MLYGDYLDYWMKEYFEINYKYSTASRYKESFKNIKKEYSMISNINWLKNIGIRTIKHG